MSLKKVIELARADLGYTESPPDSNRTKYGAWYGMNGVPWCVMALAYWFDRAGEAAAFFGGAKTASCGALLRWYREQGLTVPVEQVQAGDIVILNFSGTQDTQHCGLVLEVSRRYSTVGYVRTIEGNTSASDGSQDNGGCVALKTRCPSQIVGVCRPPYQPEPDLSALSDGTSPEGETVDDITGHWAEEDIRRCMEMGLMQGYPDGSFRPDRGVTRAELAVILRRREEMK